MKVKVCGLRDPDNIKAVAALAPDYMGFIFYGSSPRFVGNPPLKTLSELPASIHKTAVFVNESQQKILSLISQYSFDAIQLHGVESPEFCNLFKDKVKVIKAFGFDESFNFDKLNNYADKVDFFLFDTKTTIHGGSGKTFDWTLLDNYKLNVPFFLSGGLSPGNLEEVKNINHSQFYGVDLNSRFELMPGIKNTEQLRRAFNIIKQGKPNELRS